MDYVIARTHVVDHERFLEAGPHARDLWLWGMLYAGKHETDGALSMAAVIAAPWGHGGKANVKAASKLVEVGLWERTDAGYQILKWAEMGNKTKAQITEARDKWRAKKKTQRAPSKTDSPPECPQGTPPGTPTDVLNSTSYSPSRSGSLGGAGGAAPAWWAAAIATAEQAVGGTIDQVGARWLEYDAARERKGWARSQRDAVGWLTTVVRTERRNQRAGPKSDAATTRQPFDPEAPWIKLGDTGT